MPALVISDLHSNIEALTAVLSDAGARSGFDVVLCAGDIVGYGPDPAAVISTLQTLDFVAVAGNHDLAALGQMSTSEFNPVAAAAAEWTAMTLTPRDRAYLESLPLIREYDAITLVHGSLRSPEWEYLLSAEQADAQFALQTTPYSIVGHSHLQFWFEEHPGGAPVMRTARDGTTLQLGPTRLILNPGSTGQPRDGDPRAEYMLYDEAAATVTWHRVAYDAQTTRRKIIDTGLPPWLGERLLEGR